MGFVKSGLSAVGKFFIVVALAGAFIVGLVSVVYMSLKGEEVQIPEIVGKDFKQSEDGTCRARFENPPHRQSLQRRAAEYDSRTKTACRFDRQIRFDDLGHRRPAESRRQ